MKKILLGQYVVVGNGIGDNLIKKFFRFFSNVYLFSMIVMSLCLVVNDTIIDTMSAMRLYGLAAIMIIVKTASSKKMVFFSPIHIIILYTIVSNFGYDILVLLYPELFKTIISLRHAYSDYFNLANALYYLGTMALVLGFERKKNGNNTKQIKELYYSFDSTERIWYMRISIIFLYVYVGYLILQVITGKLPLTNYLEVKEYFSTRAELMYMLRMVWVVMPTYIFFAKNTVKDLLPFGAIVAIMFLILMFTGNRNEILYPLSMTLGVFVWKRFYLEEKSVPSYIILVSLVIVFVVNPMISNSRKEGFNSLFSGAFGLVEGLMEMGQQLNPFSIILYALDKDLYSFQNGMTIIVPSVSILTLNIVFGTKLYQNSQYNPTYVLNQLGHFGRGFSYMAELYVNFGVIGMVLLFWGYGTYARNCESGYVSKNVLLMYFQISTLFMLWTRNTLALNIVIIIFAVILQVTVRCISQRKRKHSGDMSRDISKNF